MYNILIVDDVSTIIWGLKSIIGAALGSSVCRFDHCNRGEDLLTLIAQNNYDLIFVDINVSGINGLPLLKEIIATQEDPRIIVMSKLDREFLFEKVMDVGEVKAFLCKRSSESDIQQALHKALVGKKFVPEVQQQILDKVYTIGKDALNPFSLLSFQEQKVAHLLLKGHGILEVSNELAITSSTASTYKSRIFKKLNISNVIELNNHAAQFGFLMETLN